jgi:type IV pilus assembly protein PilM
VFSQGKKKAGAVVGVHIEAGSIAAAEVRINGAVQVAGAGVQSLSEGAFADGEVADSDAIARALKELFSANKLSKQVRLGIGNQRVVVRTMRLPAIEDRRELEAAVRFQAQEQVAMPLDQAVLDHQVVGGVAGEDGTAPQIDVVVVAARRDMVASCLEPLRRAGLEPVGVDLSAFAMIRALGDLAAPAGEKTAELPFEGAPAPIGAVMYCHIGDTLNLAVARGRACLFTRVSQAGMEEIAARLSAQSSLSHEHASQWLSHVGLASPVDEVEGDTQMVGNARAALDQGADELVDELRLSLDYYAAQEAAVPVERVMLAGPGSAIEGMSTRLEAGLGMPVSVGHPAALTSYGDETAARLTLAYGLALEV